MQLKRPYLLFLGDVPDALAAKTAIGIVDWRKDWCVGQMRLPGCKADTGLPDMDLQQATQAGAQTFVIGVECWRRASRPLARQCCCRA